MATELLGRLSLWTNQWISVWITQGVRMRRKVSKRKKKGEILQGIVGTGVCIGMVGWLLIAWLTEPMPDWSEYINEHHIGQVEISEGYWMSQEDYKDYEAERAAYLESEAESERAFIDAVMNAQSTESVPSIDDRWTKKECYMLAKLAMAEAEGEDIKGKALVIRTVLNRVNSRIFPDTIEGVIMQKNQFTPIRNGRYDRVEPDEDCYEALEMVEDGWDESKGALYFERNTDKDTWHKKNLTKLFTHGNHTFYTGLGGE